MTDILPAGEKYRLQMWAQNHQRHRQDGKVEKNFSDWIREMRKAASVLELPTKTSAAAIASQLQGMEKL